MMFLLPLGLALVFLGMWISRRGSSLTRACRWRQERHLGEGHFRCAACGAECDLPPGEEPRQCLRGPRNPQQ